MTIAELSDRALDLADLHWPGALTLVLVQRSPTSVAALATAGLDTIAVRVPAHPVARELIACEDERRERHPFTDEWPGLDLDTGYAVQDRALALRRSPERR